MNIIEEALRQTSIAISGSQLLLASTIFTIGHFSDADGKGKEPKWFLKEKIEKAKETEASAKQHIPRTPPEALQNASAGGATVLTKEKKSQTSTKQYIPKTLPEVLHGASAQESMQNPNEAKSKHQHAKANPNPIRDGKLVHSIGSEKNAFRPQVRILLRTDLNSVVCMNACNFATICK